MKFSVSKTINLGPLRITASKSGLSFSFGVPGARASINTKGQAGVRIGVPGVPGLSFNKTKKVLPSLMSMFK